MAFDRRHRTAAGAREALGRVRQLPAVESATLALTAPGGFEGVGIGGIGRRGAAQMLNDGDLNGVDSAYFRTMRIRLIAGRDFTAADRQGSQPVVILGAGAAAQLWPGKAVGEILGETVMQYPFGAATVPSQAVPMQIVGIVSDVKYGSLVDGAADVQVRPTDAITFVSAGLLFGATTLLACCVPAYRATRIPPTDALRAE